MRQPPGPVKPSCPRALTTCAVAIAVALLAGCGSLARKQPQWPTELPPLAFFRHAYADDAENRAVQSEQDYLSWVYRFYKGWIAYPVGWLDISAGVVASVPSERRARVSKRLVSLGREIAAEWAKASESRVVFKQTLAAWGEVLTEAVNRGEVEQLLDRVEGDLHSLLARRLSPAAIRTERYYPDLDDGDPFAS